MSSKKKSPEISSTVLKNHGSMEVPVTGTGRTSKRGHPSGGKKKTIMLNKKQQEAVQLAAKGKDIFLTGGAGTGKSFLINMIIQDLKKNGKAVMVCAPTAAAANLVQGATIHKTFGFPIGPLFTSKGRPIIRCPEIIRKTDVVVIDEISMCRIDLFDSIISSVEKAEKQEGKHIQLILSGDFFQLPPVVTSMDEKVLTAVYGRAVGGAYAFRSEGWKRRKIKLIQLEEPVRAKDKEYADALSAIRLGRLESIPYFNEKASRDPFPDALTLFGRNEAVDRYNFAALDEIEGPSETFYPVSSISADMGQVLELKIGARVVITANYSPSFASYVDMGPGSYRPRDPFHNGSMGTVVDMYKDPEDPFKDYLIVQIDNNGCMYIGRKVSTVYEYVLTPKGIAKHQVGQKAQIPVRLGYALTIHRAQGMTLDKVNIHPSCFAPGQLYVALSRVSRVSDIHLLAPINKDAVLADPAVCRFYENWAAAPKEEAGPSHSHIKEEIPEEKAEETAKGEVPGNERRETKPGKAIRPKGRPRKHAGRSVLIRMPKALAVLITSHEPDAGFLLDTMAKLVLKSDTRTSDLVRRQTEDTVVIRISSDNEGPVRCLVKAICPRKGYLDKDKFDRFRKEIEKNGKDNGV